MANNSKPAKTKKRLGRGLSSLVVNSADIAAIEPVAPAAPANSASVDTLSSYVGTTLPTQSIKAASLAPISVSPAATESKGTPLSIPIDKIRPNPFQPRKVFSSEELSDLASSISTQGILQPLLVREPVNGEEEGSYVLIAGERRLRAASQAGLESVPCVLRQATGREMLEWALIENIQREDLNPIEQGEAYRHYIDRFELTQAQAAEKLGIGRVTIANHLRLLELQSDVQEILRLGQITFGHAKVLAGLVGQPARQLILSKRVIRDGLSVRHLESLVAAGPVTEKPAAPVKQKQAYVVDMEEQLTQSFGTRVSIKPGRSKNTGRVVVEYYSLDDFDRLTEALGAKQAEL